MMTASLMTLPSELRLLIWKQAIPGTVLLKYPGSANRGSFGPIDYVSLSPDPGVCLMLLNKKANDEVPTIPGITVVVRVHDAFYLDNWCQKSTFRDRKLVSRVRVDGQCIKDLAYEKNLSQREVTAEWWIKGQLGDKLARWFSHVKVLESEVGMTLLDGFLDVTFEVGEAREERLAGTMGCHSDKVKMREGRLWEWRGHGSKGTLVR